MRCGLYGKLPSKRDFIAVSAPRAFLRLWEPWIEQGLAFGRQRSTQEEWAQAYNSAPIWRFWLGERLCGEALVGAFMPCVDAIGRVYPLTLIGAASGETPLDPPLVDPRDVWFSAVEQLLLDALDPEAPFAAILARLRVLAEPYPPGDSASPLAGGFAQMRAELRDDALLRATFWWTIGGPAVPPRAMMQTGMPDETALADMLSQRPPADEGAQDAPLQTVTQPG